MKKSLLRGIVLSVAGMLGIGVLIGAASNKKEIAKASAAGVVQYAILRNSTVYATGDSKTSGKWSWDFYAYHHEDTQDTSWIEYTTHEWNNFRITYNAAGATKKLSYITFEGKYESTDGSYLVVQVTRNGITKDVGTINQYTIGACGTNIGTFGDTIYIKASVRKSDGSESGNGKLFFKNCQLYYNDSHTVTFNANGHGTAPSAATVDDGAKVSKPSDPTAAGYTFGGWYKEAACTNAWNFNSDTVTADVTLFAKWTANKYTVTLDRQGGTTGSTSAQATYGQSMPSISVPTREGYSFGGYFTGTNGSGTEYYSSTGSSNKAYTQTSALTLYAKWTANKYTVTLDRQGGSGGSASVQATFDSAMPSITIPSKTGYDFGGYFSGTNGSGTQYYTESGASAHTWDQASNKTLYAKWTLKQEIQDVIDLIDDIGTVEYPDSKGDIEIAEFFYEDLDEAYKPLVSNYDDLLAARDEYEDQKAAAIQNVIDLINEIGNVTYPYSKGTIEAAEDAYLGLDADDLDQITNDQTLFKARSVYDSKKDEAIDRVNNAIESLGEISYPNSKKAIEDAEKLYSLLAADDQNTTNVPNHGDLVDARNDYNQQRDDAVQDVIDAINNISQPLAYPDAEEEIETARELFDALGSSERNLATIPNFPRLVDAEKADAVVEQIELASQVIDPASYEQEIQKARAAYEALTANQKAFVPANVLALLDESEAALDVIDIINKIGDVKYTDKSKGLIDEAREAYENLSDEQKELVNNFDKLTQAETDYNKVKEVVEKINAIGKVEFTPESKELIDAAKNAYDQLTDYQKSILPRDALNTLMSGYRIYDAMEKIDDIGVLEYTQESKALVEAAREACDILTPDEIAKVTNYSKLTKAENDLLAVDKAVAKALDIGEIEYGSVSQSKIQAAKTAYNNLTADQKALYPQDIKDLLDNYEHAYAALEKINAIGKIQDSDDCRNRIVEAAEAYGNLSDIEKMLIDSDEIQTLNNAVEAMEVIKKINAIGDVEYTPESKASINAARSAFNGLTDEQKALVVNYGKLVVAEETYSSVDAFVAQVNNITSIGYDKPTRSKIDAAIETYEQLTEKEASIVPEETLNRLRDLNAAYFMIGEIQNVKKVEYTDSYLEALQNARENYDHLTPSQQALISNYADLVAAEADYSAIDSVVQLIKGIGNLSYGAESKGKIDAARAGYNALTDEQKARFPSSWLKQLANYEKAYSVLEKINTIGSLDDTSSCKARIQDARESYNELSGDVKKLINSNSLKPLVDAEAAIKVIEKIANIGKLQYNYQSKALMEEARRAYSELTDDQKLLVSNYQVLTKDETDYNAVHSVVNLINNLGTPRYGQEYKDKLQAARAAYDALTQDQKDIFPSDLLAKLVDYEAVYETLEKIHSIGNNPQDAQDARDAYEGLTEEQKVLVDASEYGYLVSAESRNFNSESESRVMITIYYTIAVTMLVAGALSLFLLLFSRRNKEEENKGASKTMAVGGLSSLMIFASQYLNPQYITLYILAGAAVIAWIAVIVILIARKKKAK